MSENSASLQIEDKSEINKPEPEMLARFRSVEPSVKGLSLKERIMKLREGMRSNQAAPVINYGDAPNNDSQTYNQLTGKWENIHPLAGDTTPTATEKAVKATYKATRAAGARAVDATVDAAQRAVDATVNAAQRAARAGVDAGEAAVGFGVDTTKTVVGAGIHAVAVATKPGREYFKENVAGPAGQPRSTTDIDYGPGPSNTSEQLKPRMELTPGEIAVREAAKRAAEATMDAAKRAGNATVDAAQRAVDATVNAAQRAERATVDFGVAAVGTGVHAAGVMTKPGRDYLQKNVFGPATQDRVDGPINYGPGPASHDREFTDQKAGLNGMRNEMVGDTKPTGLENAVAGAYNATSGAVEEYVKTNITEPAQKESKELPTGTALYGEGPKTHDRIFNDRKTGQPETVARNEMVGQRGYGLFERTKDRLKHMAKALTLMEKLTDLADANKDGVINYQDLKEMLDTND